MKTGRFKKPICSKIPQTVGFQTIVKTALFSRISAKIFLRSLERPFSQVFCQTSCMFFTSPGLGLLCALPGLSLPTSFWMSDNCKSPEGDAKKLHEHTPETGINSCIVPIFAFVKPTFYAKLFLYRGKSGNFALQSVDMPSLETFKIDLKSLPEGESVMERDLGDDFFEAIGATDVRSGQLHTTLTIHRRDDFFELLFHTAGMVTVPCDLCLDDMDQPIEASDRLTAHLGQTDSEGDDIVTVSEEEGILDVAWFVYESIALNIPLRHVHAPGKCNPAMMNILEEHSAARSGDEDGEETVDSRWAALKDLKITN